MTIAVSTPTVMDGQVIRWYANAADYMDYEEMASASRNGVTILSKSTPQEVRDVAEQAHQALASRRFTYDEIKQRFATHQEVGRLFFGHEQLGEIQKEKP